MSKTPDRDGSEPLGELMPTRDVILLRIRNIVAGHTGRSLEEVRPDASFLNDLGCDSLDTTEILIAIEEAFNTAEIPDDVWSPIDTCAGYADYLVQALPTLRRQERTEE